MGRPTPRTGGRPVRGIEWMQGANFNCRPASRVKPVTAAAWRRPAVVFVVIRPHLSEEFNGLER
jgi:hypothetical protein